MFIRFVFINSVSICFSSQAGVTDGCERSIVNLLYTFSAVTFFVSTFNLQLRERRVHDMVVNKPKQGVLVRVGRKILQVSGYVLQENGDTRSSGVGTIFLGWGMAFIYMGGRLPQICLNIKRGNVEGLNPLMFVFALIGNTTYVARILYPARMESRYLCSYWLERIIDFMHFQWANDILDRYSF